MRPVARRCGIALVLASTVASCAHPREVPAPARVETATRSPSFDDCDLGQGGSIPTDFPRGLLAPAGPPERTLACTLSMHLDALGEPSLFPLGDDSETYRLLWLRTIRHPVSVRFDRDGTTAQVRGAQTGGKGAAPPGELLEESTVALSPESVRDLLSRVEAARVWDPTPAPSPDALVDDGSTWVFEGARSGQYRVRVFHRESLARDPAFHELGLSLVRLSGLHIEGGVY